MSDEQVPAENAQKPEPPNQSEKIFAILKEWRDNLLILVGVFYVAGYLMWAWFSLENNLGLQPALQFQYIVAGVGPVVITLLAVGGGIWFWKLLETKWLNNLETNPSKFWEFLRGVFRVGAFFTFVGFVYAISPSVALLTGIGSVVFALFINKESSWLREKTNAYIKITPYDNLSDNDKTKRALLAIAFLGAIAFVVINKDKVDTIFFTRLLQVLPKDMVFLWLSYSLAVVFIFGGTTLFPDWLTKLYRALYVFVIALVFVLIGIIFYKERIYTKLPQEFGGVSPRCAYLDVKTENLSSDTHQVLLGTVPNDSTPPVLRTVQLDILFTSTSVLMARPHTDTSEQGVVYEIPRSNVQSITWCK